MSTTKVTPRLGGTGITVPSITAFNNITGFTATGLSGTGNLVSDNSPTLITPTLGAASATSINKITFTAPATSATITLADGSSLITAGAFATTLTATAATNVTLPITGTLATLAGTENLTNKTVNDTTFTIQNTTTNSKKLRFLTSGISAGQTRVVTVQDLSGTMILHNSTTAFTTIQSFNNGLSTFGEGLTVQTGGISLGDYTDSTTTGANAEVVQAGNDYSQREFTNAGLVSIKGVQIVAAYLLCYVNSTGNPITIINNASVSGAANKIITGYGADITVPNGGSIILTFDVNSQVFRVTPSYTIPVLGATGGTINGVVIGGITPAAATFTTVSATTVTAALTGIASGNTSYTANQYGLVTSGSANAMTVIAPDSSTTKVLVSGGASAVPSWQGSLSSLTLTSTSLGNADSTQGNARFTTPVATTITSSATLGVSHWGKRLIFNSATAITITLPQQSTTATVAGVWLEYENINTGLINFVTEGTDPFTGNTTCAQNQGGKLFRDTTTSWNNFGGTASVNMGGFTTLIQTVANNTYTLVCYAGCNGTILGVGELARTLTTAGTFAISINGSNVTGLTAVVPTTAGSYTAASGANTFVRGNKIQITYTGTTLVVDHALLIDYTQQF